MERPEVSRRIKAGRWLAGGVDEKGKATSLSAKELAERPPLAGNGITANRIEEFEQGRTDARQMELEKIAEALGLPGWFGAGVQSTQERVEALERKLAAAEASRESLADAVTEANVVLARHTREIAELRADRHRRERGEGTG